jgi:3-hydroxyisobutyrate dehydrogenase
MANVPASRDYTGGFGMPLMAKDMGLAVNAATETKSTVVLASLAHQVYNHVMKSPGFKNKDFSAVYKWLQNKS